MQVLLEEGEADANAQLLHGGTSLHLAARYGHGEVAEVLLASPSIDLNLVDSGGATPLHSAVKNAQFGVAALLINAGALTTTHDTSGDTAQTLAVKLGYEQQWKKVIT